MSHRSGQHLPPCTVQGAGRCGTKINTVPDWTLLGSNMEKVRDGLTKVYKILKFFFSSAKILFIFLYQQPTDKKTHKQRLTLSLKKSVVLKLFIEKVDGGGILSPQYLLYSD